MSLFGRYSSLFFTPGNNVGGILYNGNAQTAYKRDAAYGLQAEGAASCGATPSTGSRESLQWRIC